MTDTVAEEEDVDGAVVIAVNEEEEADNEGDEEADNEGEVEDVTDDEEEVEDVDIVKRDIIVYLDDVVVSVAYKVADADADADPVIVNTGAGILDIAIYDTIDDSVTDGEVVDDAAKDTLGSALYDAIFCNLRSSYLDEQHNTFPTFLCIGRMVQLYLLPNNVQLLPFTESLFKSSVLQILYLLRFI